jgi:hypothetical protein
LLSCDRAQLIKDPLAEGRRFCDPASSEEFDSGAKRGVVSATGAYL